MTSENSKKDSKKSTDNLPPCTQDPETPGPCPGGGSSSGNDDPKTGGTFGAM